MSAFCSLLTGELVSEELAGALETDRQTRLPKHAVPFCWLVLEPKVHGRVLGLESLHQKGGRYGIPRDGFTGIGHAQWVEPRLLS